MSSDMTIKLCVIMDPLAAIHVKKDTTVALLIEAQKRQWQIYYAEPKDLFLLDDAVFAKALPIAVDETLVPFATITNTDVQATKLSTFDVVLMRKDPPFDTNYLYSTYLLELAQKHGVLVVNDPRSIRDANEKLFCAWFAQCCPPTLVTSQKDLIIAFLEKHKHIVLKGLHSLGGEAVFQLKVHEPNVKVTIDSLTEKETVGIMAQRFIPEITQGDKRILMIDGEPYPYLLKRIPAIDDFRGNLAQGAKPVGGELSAKDKWICEQVGPTLKEKGLFFVGLDVIGDYLTEINVTSPTCVREIEAAFGKNICALILDKLTEKIKARASFPR
jgi:glutathione synthase